MSRYHFLVAAANTARGLGVTELDEPIQLSGYDPGWPEIFASEALRIQFVLPAGVVIEHIGSTAVPDLVAKPIVDVMIGVEAHHDTAAVRTALVAAGYEDLGEAGVPGRIYLRRRVGQAFNVALVERDGRHWRSNLALRNYLRSNPDAAREYGELKRVAVDRGICSLLAYSDFKSAFVAKLIERALVSG